MHQRLTETYVINLKAVPNGAAFYFARQLVKADKKLKIFML